MKEYVQGEEWWMCESYTALYNQTWEIISCNCGMRWYFSQYLSVVPKSLGGVSLQKKGHKLKSYLNTDRELVGMFVGL